jgi:pyruvate dehydrogenase E1 component alpha subunit
MVKTTDSRVVANFEIVHTRYLDQQGRPCGELPEIAGNEDLLRDAYRTMVLTRRYDGKALNLQRTGQIGTYGSSLGQEAVGIGFASAMTPSDVLAPTYREFSAQLWRGVTITELLLYWGGDERGSNYGGPREDFPICVPIATHCCHAVGAAYAMKLRGEERAVVCVLGDGASSKGDFYESLNAAGVWQLPVLFVVVNNQWAISVPRERQSAAQTLAQKAIAAGIPGEQVDGNDFLAVHDRAAAALRKARAGGGAHLIEALTYRIGDHTTADDASRYRDAAEVEAHRGEDPIARLRAFLESRALWDAQAEEALLKDCDERIDKALEEYQATSPQPVEVLFDYLYAELPEALVEQRQQLLKESGNG